MQASSLERNLPSSVGQIIGIKAGYRWRQITKIINYTKMTSSANNGVNERDSYLKTLMLKMGEYDV